MLYYPLKLLIYLTLKVFFKRITIQGADNFPQNGPFIIVANHPSTLLDPLLIAAVTRKKVHFLAKGSLFKNKWIAYLLGRLNMIPVYRAQDDSSMMGKNKETFDKCYEHLERKGVILLFPEGISITEKKLKPIKTGAARIALGAEARNKFTLNSQIALVGINYENPHQFRKNVVVNIGTSIPVKDFESAYFNNSHQAVQELTSAIKSQLQELIIDIDNKEHEQLTDALFDIYRHVPDHEHLTSTEINLSDFQLQKSIAEGVQFFAVHQNERYQNMVNRVWAYQSMLKELNISTLHIADKSLGKRNGWLQLIGIVVLFPVFLYGFMINYLQFRLAAWIAAKISHELEYQGPVSMVSGMFLYLITYVMGGLLAYKFSNSVIVTLLFTVSMPITGMLAYWYGQTFLVLRNKWRLLLLFLTKRSLVSKLILEREEIIREMEQAAAEKPIQVD
jgi:1-acyl-sn-glycerol-3-phosphate acyltransferase